MDNLRPNCVRKDCGFFVDNKTPPKALAPICEPFEVKSPFGDGFIQVAVSPGNERMRQLAENHRISQMFDAYYNLCGQLPPVNNIGHHEKSGFPDHWGGIRRAHLIFRGLKRPCNRPGGDSEFYTYVTKPKFRYAYKPDMVCVARRVHVSQNLLFVAVVSFFDSKGVGEVLNWEWVEESQIKACYPIDYDSRYDEEVWRNE